MGKLAWFVFWVKFVICIGFLVGIFSVLKLVFSDDKIERKTPLNPEIQISIIDGKADTTYIYTIN
jgi:hypothetical protein